MGMAWYSNRGVQWALGLLLVVPAWGCADTEGQKRLEFAQQTVQTALQAWQSGASAEQLQVGASPVEFHDDDWQLSAKLVSFELLKTYHDTDGLPRCAVKLTVQSQNEEPREVRVTYQMVTTPRVIVSRDPFS